MARRTDIISFRAGSAKRRHCFVRVGRCGGKNMHILAWSCGE